MTQPPQWGQPHQQPGYPPQGYPQQPPSGYQRPAPPMYQHQPGYQPQPPAGYPQPGLAPGLPPRPAALSTLAVLNWIIAAGLLGLAIFIVVSFLTSGGTLIIGILLAFIVGAFGALNALAAMSINHPHFPNTQASTMALGFAVLWLGGAFVKSIRRGAAELGPALGSLAFAVLCVVGLVLAARPQVKQWIHAKHQLSLSQGHVPRNARRR